MPILDPSDAAPDHHLDARGLKCPEPLLRVRHRVRAMQPGETLLVEATDPSTERDLANFCRFLDHTMVRAERDADVFRFLLRKGGQ